MKPLIFYVDDEPFNLTVFEAALPDDWDIRTYTDPLIALDDLATLSPWVIVSDQRMPKMSGVSFLEKSRTVCEKAIRIVVTGYSDEQLIIDTVRKAKIFDYIRKPWDADDLSNRIDKAVKQYEFNEKKAAIVSELLVKHRSAEKEIATKDELIKNIQDDLVRSNIELQQFASIASHDLQEPLRKIISFCNLLEQEYGTKLGEDADRWIGFVVSGAKRMQNLVQDLLNYSRVESKAKPFQQVDCNDVLGDVLNGLSMLIEDSGAKIVFENMPKIYGDRGQLIQVFQNLIANGIKFRGEKMPQINISNFENKDGIVIKVTDNGIGIDAEYFEQVFELFKRLNSKSKFEGTGIGLAICKRIVERHRGKIWIESEKNKGSSFFVQFPKVELSQKSEFGTDNELKKAV